jgi:hypothetical protein
MTGENNFYERGFRGYNQLPILFFRSFSYRSEKSHRSPVGLDGNGDAKMA